MSNLKEILRKDDQIMKVLAAHNVDRINRLICNTNQGALELEIRKGERDYHFVLGAVPVSKEVSKELLDLLFPVPVMEAPKQVNKTQDDRVEPFTGFDKLPKYQKPLDKVEFKLKKKLGRPKGSRDGVKDMK